jgi:hypothetical protein
MLYSYNVNAKALDSRVPEGPPSSSNLTPNFKGITYDDDD